MEVFVETDRLILRQLTDADAAGMFKLDSDPEVHKYLGNRPVTTMAEVENAISFIRKQYKENGIGRWAVEHKETKTFLGWAGLKLITEPVNNHVNYYDLGYRFQRQHWGLGYATESAIASLHYAFETLELNEVYAIADCRNQSSNRVLQKVGFVLQGTFHYEGQEHNWYEVRQTR